MAEWLILDVIERQVKLGISRNDYKKHVLQANMAILTLVKNTKMTFQDVESELRKRKFEHIWLQAVPASPMFDCLDVFTKKPKPWCISVTIGTFSWFWENELKRLGHTVEQNQRLLAECGVHVMKKVNTV